MDATSERDHLARRLRELLDVRNTLVRCTTIPAVVEAGLALAHDRVRPQTAAVFLFSKSGRLQRIGFKGVDRHGQPIPPEWFETENYAPGESFTGRAALPGNRTKYGDLQWSNDLERDELHAASREKYREKLGELRAAIAIPLNGLHRTFGVIEVVNKLDANRRVAGSFSSEDVYWLAVIAMSVATAISGIRRRNELRLFASLTNTVVEPFSETFELADALGRVATSLIGPFTCYQAAVIRRGTTADDLTLVARAGEQIDWSRWVDLETDTDTNYDEAVARRVLASGAEVKHTTLDAREIARDPWLKANDIKSYACFPLAVNTKVVGTLSLFLRFHHEFYTNDMEFLKSVASLLAALIESDRIIDELSSTRDDFEAEREQLMSSRALVIYDRSGHELLHKYLNELIELRGSFDQLLAANTSRRAQIIAEQTKLIDERTRDAQKRLQASARKATELRELLQKIIRYHSMELKGKKIQLTADLSDDLPSLLLNENEIREVFFNLLSNAVRSIERAQRKQGVIVLATDVIEEKGIAYVDVTVSDNGGGIPNELAEKIYERNFTTRPDGTGMGLFITREILAGYGGMIRHESTVGKGATFHVLLPLKRLMAKT